MNKSEYLNKLLNALESGAIDEDTYFTMAANADVVCTEKCDSRLPATYVELEYTSDELERNPEAILGTQWDDRNYRFYTER